MHEMPKNFSCNKRIIYHFLSRHIPSELVKGDFDVEHLTDESVREEFAEAIK